MKSGLKPAVKNRAMHGGEECAARMVKTKADALEIGGQTPIYQSIPGYLSDVTLVQDKPESVSFGVSLLIYKREPAGDILLRVSSGPTP